MKFGVIIVTYNSNKDIEKCLQALWQQSIKDFSCFILDNNSTDGTLEKISSLIANKKNYHLVKNRENIGFAKAVNQGINLAKKETDPDIFLLLNPDAILEENCLEELSKLFSDNDRLGIASPLILSPDNNIWFQGGKINWVGQKALHEKMTSPDYITGCVMAIKKETVEKIGLFDEHFFLYYEDADYSLRAKKAGFDLELAENAKAWHKESSSMLNSDFKTYHLVKSGLTFFHKHSPPITRPYFWINLGLRHIFHRLISKKTCVLNGIKDFHKSV